MRLEQREPVPREQAPRPALVVVPPAPADDADLCRAPDDLTVLADAELYALEADRCLVPTEWHRVEDELRRRRAGRAVGEADVVLGATPAAATVGDLERIAENLEARIAARLAMVEARTRALRWWTMAAPLVWGLAALAAFGAWSVVADGATWATFQAALLD
jgi:hypothetical protein